LEIVEQRAEAASQQALEYAQRLERANQRADAALSQASEAERKAQTELSARVQAESEAERRRQQSEIARAQTEQAREQTVQAWVETRQATEELERLRQRREEELRRMQEALSKVAPTKRTPAGLVMQLSNDSFRFDFDKATLRPENRETLSRIAGILLASEGYRLFIDGHTDDIGTEEYNQDLSDRRAKSVRDYLVNAGIPPEIVTTQGFGKSNPLAGAKTREARQKNRRVEIGIVDTIISYRGEVKKK
jgi:outer membrane protein OmpA-like peptidoglycan-associated protein